jgi:predicted metal-binding protein
MLKIMKYDETYEVSVGLVMVRCGGGSGYHGVFVYLVTMINECSAQTIAVIFCMLYADQV